MEENLEETSRLNLSLEEGYVILQISTQKEKL